MPSPTELSLKLLRSQGCTVEVVERWLPGANIRKDLFNVIDLIAMGGDYGQIQGVQATTLSSYQNHVAKLKEHADKVKLWLQSGGIFVMHCWGTRQVNRKATRRVKISVAYLSARGRLTWAEEEFLDPFKKDKQWARRNS